MPLEAGNFIQSSSLGQHGRPKAEMFIAAEMRCGQGDSKVMPAGLRRSLIAMHCGFR